MGTKEPTTAMGSAGKDEVEVGPDTSATVVTVVSPGEGYRVDDKAQAVLAEIRETSAPTRFLQNWDAKARVLTFGLSDGTQGVLVRSDRTIGVATAGVLPSQFSKVTLERVRHAAPSSTKTLVGGLQATFERYLHFEDTRLGLVFALWTLGTYVYTVFSHYGYLHLYSNQPRSGKTRALELIQHLGFQASQPLNAPTAPVMRDMAAEGGTLLFDTLERWPKKSQEAYHAAMEMLDAGFRSGGTVAKLVPVPGGGWRKEFFPVYAPYALAGIERTSLSETALDRSFPVHMQRKSTKVRKAPYRFDACAAECAPIRDDCYVWALQHADDLATVYEGAPLERQMQQMGLNDRAGDVWKPLFAIASLAGLDASTLTGLEALAQETGGDPDFAEEARRLKIATALASEVSDWKEQRFVGPTSDVLVLLQEIHGIALTSTELHALLTEWGFTQKNVRIPGGNPRRSWELHASELRRVEERLKETMAPDPATQ